jgi:hypothetical protein
MAISGAFDFMLNACQADRKGMKQLIRAFVHGQRFETSITDIRH